MLLLDQTLPGTVRSYDLLREWVIKDPLAVASTAQAYTRAYSAWLAEQVLLGRLNSARAARAKEILDGLALASPFVGAAADIIGTAVNAAESIPGVGSVIKGVYQIVHQFVEAAAAAAKEGKKLWGGRVSVGDPIFTGFQGATYYCWDVPVWSFTAPMWITQFKTISPPAGQVAWGPVFDAFEALATRRPFGPPVPRVLIENDGSYFYQFNLKGNGDYSSSAAARDELRSFQVWNPADISPSGPRGFDPANPLAWKRPGKKASVFDPVPAPLAQPPGAMPSGTLPAGAPPEGPPPEAPPP